LVEQLTCGIDKQNVYFELSCTFIGKPIKWTSLIRGRLSIIYVNPELENLFSSVETLYDVPKVLILWQRESPDRKHIYYGNENCSGMNQ